MAVEGGGPRAAGFRGASRFLGQQPRPGNSGRAVFPKAALEVSEMWCAEMPGERGSVLALGALGAADAGLLTLTPIPSP